MTFNPASFFALAKNPAHRIHPDVPAMEPTPILVVDDEEGVRRYAGRILTGAGFLPVMAGSGPEAIDKAAGLAECPLLVTDLMMPDMTGAELARRLRGRTPALKVLYLTGFADRLFAERVMLWEDEAYLEKPFTRNGLLEAVALLLTGHAVAEALPSPQATSTA